MWGVFIVGCVKLSGVENLMGSNLLVDWFLVWVEMNWLCWFNGMGICWIFNWLGGISIIELFGIFLKGLLRFFGKVFRGGILVGDVVGVKGFYVGLIFFVV